MNYQKMYHFNELFGLDLRRRTNKREYVWARYAVMYYLRKSLKPHTIQNLFLMSYDGVNRGIKEFERALSVGDKLATSLNARLSDFKTI